MKLFGKERAIHPLDVFFLGFVLFYLFTTYSPWLTNECVATLTGDVNHHLSHYVSFAQHLNTYKWWYPIDYQRDNDGFFWYFVLPIPYILPLLLSTIFPFFYAFFFTYVFFYFLLVLGIYLFLLRFCNRFVAIMMSAFLLTGPILNLIFSVGGNYHFFYGLTFFIFTLLFFYLFVMHQKKRDLLLFSVFFILLGSTYYFSLLFFLLFAFVYLLSTRSYKLLLYLLFLIGILSLFLVPTTIQTLTFEEKTTPLPLSQLFMNHILPKYGLTSWIYMDNPPYDSTRDQNHGPHIYLAGIIALFLLLFIIKDRSPTFKFFFIYFLVLAFLMFLPFTTTIVPPERLMVHVYMGFFFLTAYALSKMKIHFYALIAVLALSAYVLRTTFFTSQLYYFLIPVGVALAYYYLKKGDHPFTLQKEDYIGMLISALLLFIIIFPITGKVEGTTFTPRTSHFTLNNIDQVIKPTDTFAYVGGFTMDYAIQACTRASSNLAGGSSRDQAISNQKELDLFDPSEKTLEGIHFKNINKIIIPVEIIQTNGQINTQKINHLLQWFGNPVVFTAQFHTYQGNKKLGDSPYPLVIFTVPPSPKNYTLQTRTPITLDVTKNEKNAEAITNIQYHPWWRAFANGKRIPIQNKEGHVFFSNVQGIRMITLQFSMFYFYLGRILSVLSLLLVFLLYTNYEHIPRTIRKEAWRSFITNAITALKQKISRKP